MEALGVLALIAVFILWIRLMVVSDRVNGLRYRIQRLEKQLQERTQSQTADEPIPAEASVQTGPAETVCAAAQPAEETARPEQPVRTESAVSSAKSTGQNTQLPQEQRNPSEPFSPVKLFSWIGGFTLFLGIAFWIKYAIENGWFSPALRISCSVIFGAGLWIAGVLIRQERYKVTAHTLAAAGLCICYAAWFSAYYFYQLLPFGATFALLALTSLWAFGTAVWKRAAYIGVLAQITGFFTPFLISRPNPDYTALLTYTAFIALAAGAAALRRKWDTQLVSCAVFVGIFQLLTAHGISSYAFNWHTLYGFTVLFSAFFAMCAYARKQGTCFLVSAIMAVGVFCQTPSVHTLPQLWFWPIAVFAFFTAAVFVCRKRFQENPTIWTAVCLLGLAAGIHLEAEAHSLWGWHAGIAPLLFACLFGVLTERAARWQDEDANAREFRQTAFGATAAFFLTAAIVLLFKNQWLTYALAAEACGVIWLKRLVPHEGLLWLGKVLFVCVAVRLVCNPWVEDYFAIHIKILNGYLALYGVCAGLTLLAARGWTPKEQTGSVLFLRTLAGGILFALVNVEIADFFGTNGSLNWDMFGDLSVAAAFTVAWILCGAGCLFAAASNRKSLLYKAGLALVGAALFKLFLSDIWRLSLGARIIVTICTAVILIGVSFVFQRMRQTQLK